MSTRAVTKELSWTVLDPRNGSGHDVVGRRTTQGQPNFYLASARLAQGPAGCTNRLVDGRNWQRIRALVEPPCEAVADLESPIVHSFLSAPSSQNPQLARPRRASRAPVRFGAGAGDENAPSAASAAVPRAALAGKAVVAPVGKQAVQQVKGVQVAPAQGVQAPQARRAFGDVSNAGGRVSLGSAPREGHACHLAAVPLSRHCELTRTFEQTQVDRSAAVTVPVRPATRSRPPSAQGPPAHPQAPSSTGTGFGRLRIDSHAQPSAPAPPRAATAAVAGKARRALSARAPVQPAAVAPAAPRIQQGEWPGAQSAFGGHAIKQAVNEHGVVPTVGLGLGSAAEAWMGDQMAVDRHYPHAGPSNTAGHKRTHDIEFSDEEEQNSAAHAAHAVAHAHGHGHGHLQGALQHEDKVRVVEDDVEVGDGEADQDGEMQVDPDDWLLQLCDEDEAVESERLIEEIKREFKEEIDYFDISMVAEYSDEIFEYMAELEVRSSPCLRSSWRLTNIAPEQEASMPNPRYMDHQSEIEWCVAQTSYSLAPRTDLGCSAGRCVRP